MRDTILTRLTGSAIWNYAVFHKPTDCLVAEFATKREAAEFAGELYAKLTAEQWQSSDVHAVRNLLMPHKGWIIAADARRWQR